MTTEDNGWILLRGKRTLRTSLPTNECKKNTKEMAVTVWNALCGAYDQFNGQDVWAIAVGPKFKLYHPVMFPGDSLASHQWYLC